ncbi:MAG: C4-type zinc ribbon domain-containing protein [Acidobacteria bacterium]|nr:C4-type zinc ribbon domain-containing protein [Acidobacteriota bacterium]
MIEEVEQAVRLEEVDRRLITLTQEIAELPKHIAQIEKQLIGHLKQLEAEKAALAANQKERKQKELDVQAANQKISKLRDQMMSAKTNEQYKAFQHEIEFCEGEIRKAEERSLELMTASEPLTAAVKVAELALAEEKKQVEAEKASARERSVADQQAVLEAKAKRAELAATLPPPLLANFERLRKKFPKGPIVADATKGQCSACHMKLRPQYFEDLKRATKVMNCESCGRIIRYAPVVDQQAMFDGGTRVSMS